MTEEQQQEIPYLKRISDLFRILTNEYATIMLQIWNSQKISPQLLKRAVV